MKHITFKKPLSYYIGNTLIVLSLGFFAFVLYPLLFAYFLPPKVKPLTSLHGFYITIPKIHAQAPVISGVDPWNETVYRAALRKGVAQAKGTGFPGEKRMIYLFAHSSDFPWEITRFNTIFLRLGELRKNDTIILSYHNMNYTYDVYETKEVWPSEVEAVTQTKGNVLILQTCTPVGTALKRLLVYAKEH